ncbi:Ras GTPase-activating protein [Balamuthia mandrillaris]
MMDGGSGEVDHVERTWTPGSSSAAALSSSNGSDDSRGRTYSVHSLFKIIKGQDQEKGDELAHFQKMLYEMKRDIAIMSKKNFTLERDIRNLDRKIALLIRNRISIEEIMTNSGDMSLLNKTGQIKNKRDRELYGELFWLLQHETKYIAALARIVSLAQIDNLLQTVMFTLYGNQYDEMEEHLLLSMFRTVLDKEFKEAQGIGSLLRANTALTRMMTTYTRRGPGQVYLKETLTGVLSDLCNQGDLVLEVNPLKVYIEYINDYEIKNGVKSELNRKVTAEEAAEHPDVQRIVKPRIAKLDAIAGTFIKALVNSTNSVPYGIRWICKQIRDLVKEKFPDATREQVCSLIGGFYLLRFINPAIVTPQAFMLVESKLSANTRRNLTLLAKILQNLANNIKFGGVKEFYMEPLNVCLEKNRESLNSFLEEMTNVDNLEQHLNLDRYLALGRTHETTIHISLNEMYFIHDILVKHKDEVITSEADKPLADILCKLGAAPQQLPRKDNANVDLVLSDRYKEEDKSSAGKLSPEQIYTETKFLLFTIIKALPADTADTSTQSLEKTLLLAKKYADKNNNKELAEKIARIQKNCQDLVSAGYLKEDDNYAQLRKDAVQELLDYEDQIVKTKSLLQRLEEVIANIQNHQQFLEDQYEAYKSYLEDVTEKCSSTQSSKKDRKSKNKKQKDKKAKVVGPFKYTYNQLEKDGIIKESEVPKDRRNHITFSFSSSVPGVYTVTVSWRNKKIASVQLELADLLERQQENRIDYETEFLKLDVNLLLHLLNKHFVSGK